MKHYIQILSCGSLFIFSLLFLSTGVNAQEIVNSSTPSQNSRNLVQANDSRFRASDLFGVGAVDDMVDLGSQDPRVIAARLINVLLGFLSIIVVVLIIYSGFLWMISGGNEERVVKARKTFVNALIGLLIILTANSIVLFVIRSLSEATGADFFDI